MTGTWDSSKVAAELQGVSADASKLEERLTNIFRFGDPAVCRRLEKIGALEIDLSDLILSARKVAERLLDELEYPNGGSHRKPEHWDSAS